MALGDYDVTGPWPIVGDLFNSFMGAKKDEVMYPMSTRL